MGFTGWAFAQGSGSQLKQLEERVSSNPDSVKQILTLRLQQVQDDRKRIGIHHVLGLAYNELGAFDSAVFHLKSEDSLMRNYTPAIEAAVNNQSKLGDIYYAKGDLTSAEIYYQSALDFARKSDDYTVLCKALLSCGWISREQGKHADALDYYFEAIKLAEANEDESLLASSYSKIAIVYNVKGDLPKAREYYYKALDIRLQQGNMPAVSSLYNNIGLMHEYKDDFDSAIWFFELSQHICDSLGDMRGVAIANENIGLMHYRKLTDLDEGISKLKFSLDYWRSLNDTYGQSQNLVYMVFIFNAQGKYNTALDSAYRALDMARESGARDVEQQALEQIYLAYNSLGKFDKALQYYQQFDQLRDSLNSLNSSAQIDRLGLEHEFESRQLKDSVNMAMQYEKEQAAIKVDVEAGKFWNKLLLFGMLAFILVTVLVYFLARQQKRNAQLVQRTNHILQAKNKEIIDSINYAKRIQSAILPSDNLIRNSFKNSFVFYRPKDIVAGDFYWLSELEEESVKTTCFAVADCTGHGVPGAMVSVICSSALNKVVNEQKITSPGEILSRVTDLVIETFEKNEHALKDGMDICLITLEESQSNGERIIHYAGANNGLWIVSDRAHVYPEAVTINQPGSSLFLHEIKATKQPVGRFTKRIPFENHTIRLKANEQLYLYTDGYADQFGGAKNKKFKYSSLKRLILSIANANLDEQREALKKNFEDWKGAMEQIDDVCVVGVRI